MIARRYHPPSSHGSHLRLHQPCLVPLLGPISFHPWTPTGLLTGVGLRITPRHCFSSATHTRPSSSRPSFTSCSRIYPRTPKCRRPSFGNGVCRGRPMQSSSGAGCLGRSGFFRSVWSDGNHRWAASCRRTLESLCPVTNAPFLGWPVFFAAHEMGRTAVLCRPTYVASYPIFFFFFLTPLIFQDYTCRRHFESHWPVLRTVLVSRLGSYLRA